MKLYEYMIDDLRIEIEKERYEMVRIRLSLILHHHSQQFRVRLALRCLKFVLPTIRKYKVVLSAIRNVESWLLSPTAENVIKLKKASCVTQFSTKRMHVIYFASAYLAESAAFFENSYDTAAESIAFSASSSKNIKATWFAFVDFYESLVREIKLSQL